MISLYIHIPFCTSKCAYCSFNSTPTHFSDTIIDEYIVALKKEIDHYAESIENKEVKTLYFWWGTPSKIGSKRIIDIIEYIKTKFDLENLAELSIELNPTPQNEVIQFVDIISKTYKDFPRVRFSFGIQSLDDEILKTVWRAYNFAEIAEFLRTLVQHKKEHVVFNFDFIAFGKFQISKKGHKQLWHEFKRDFFQDFLASWYADSISLYTLENIKDKQCPIPYHGSDDEIMEEFLILKKYIEDAGYQRYEISNFTKAGKASIHNMVYWNMEPYIWFGLSAASFLPMQNAECKMQKLFPNSNFWILNSPPSRTSEFWIRWTNTWDIKKYIEGNRIDKKEIQTLNKSDLLIEEFFLRLRTREGIADIAKFTSVLIKDYELRIANFKKEELVEFDGTKLRLTDEGMNVYNGIVTDLLQKL